MKNINFKSILKIGALGVLGAWTFVACEKNLVAEDPAADVCNGTPSLSSVTIPTDRTKTIAEGELTNWIVVKGANLCSVNSIKINDVSVNVKEASIKGSEITFKIPKVVPKDVNNKITVSGTSGTATLDFKVNIPALIVSGFGGAIEEFTAPGQNVIIKGENFDLYGFTLEATSVIFGTTSVKATKVTDTEIHATIPANTTAGTVVKVKNATLEKEVYTRYKDTRGIIYDLDPTKEGWTPTVVSNGPSPSAILNNYCVMAADYTSAWGWQEEMHIADMVKFADLGITPGSVDRYVVKLEVNVPTDWTSNPLRIWWKSKSGTFNYNFPWGGGSFNGAAYKTSGWQTVTIPLSDFIYSEDDAGANKGKKVTTLDAASVNDYTETRLFIQGPDAKKMNLYWDNFRIVPK